MPALRQEEINRPKYRPSSKHVRERPIISVAPTDDFFRDLVGTAATKEAPAGHATPPSAVSSGGGTGHPVLRLGGGIHRVERLARGHEQPVALGATNAAGKLSGADRGSRPASCRGQTGACPTKLLQRIIPAGLLDLVVDEPGAGIPTGWVLA